jgi:hypothetical protein
LTPSPDDTRAQRLAELEAQILATAEAAPDTAEELSELSARAHRAIVRGDFGREATELRVRLHGDGVRGHRVPADQAGAVLRQTQLLVRWIGARLRSAGDHKQMTASTAERLHIVDATRLYLRPQFGAGSLIFDLIADEPSMPVGEAEQGELVDASPHIDSLLDRSLQELLNIISSSESDTPESLGELSGYVSRMGPRVASQLKRLAIHVTDEEIDIDLRWLGSGGRRGRANLGRRGALAIRDAVDRNKVKVDEIRLTGLLETASTGKDQVRIETSEESFKMDVDEELGVTLGRWLHQEVTALVERRVTWHDSGKETRSYKLLAINPEPRMDDGDHHAEGSPALPGPDESLPRPGDVEEPPL